MKTKLVVVLLMMLTMAVQGQDKALLGEWEIYEFGMTRDGNAQITSKKDLDAQKSVWELFFYQDGSMKQQSNMRTGEIEGQKGTWELKDDKLYLNMTVNERPIQIVYRMEIVGEKMALTRSNPNQTMQIKVLFQRKKT